MKDNKNISRFLSLVLRHKPETIGIKLDKNGWVLVTDLLEALDKAGKTITQEELKVIVDTNDKKRFEFDEDEIRIRAAQGHSINVDLQLKANRPPRKLYHGTSKEVVDVVLQQGLKKMTRDHVHLSEDFDTAEKVGMRRKGPTYILDIDAARMYADGVKFYQSSNGVWLTNFVDPKYIS